MTDTAELTPTEEVALSRIPDRSVIETAFGLPAGSFHPVGIDLETADLTYDQWEGLGHFLGDIHRWGPFAIGDWLRWGEDMWEGDGDIWAQAIEATPSERYDVANRVTGLNPEALRNYASTSRRVPRDVRRVELSYTHHEAVAALDPDEQRVWLDRAVTEGWNRDALRAEIRSANLPPPADGDPDGSVTVLPPPLSLADRKEALADGTWSQMQPTTDGSAVIPAALVAQYRALYADSED
jgi:hypothetical protein